MILGKCRAFSPSVRCPLFAKSKPLDDDPMKMPRFLALAGVLLTAVPGSAQEVETIPPQWHGYYQAAELPCPPEFDHESALTIEASVISFLFYALEVERVAIDGMSMTVSGIGMAEGDEWPAEVTFTMVDVGQLVFDRTADNPDGKAVVRCSLGDEAFL